MKFLIVVVVGLIVYLAAAWGARRKLRIIQAQLEAYRRGDYEAQLKIVEGLRGKNSGSTSYDFFHGAACYQLGRLKEAEESLRRSLSAERNAPLRVICRDELGRVLMAEERWNEAEDCFRTVIAESPKRGGGHRALAEWQLRRGGDQAAALESARTAVASDRVAAAGASGRGKQASAIDLGESLAVFAWALAVNREDRHEAESAIEEAFSACGVTTKPVLAEVHYCAGQAALALGESKEGRRHFECASEIDPAGHYGRLSRAALAASEQPA